MTFERAITQLSIAAETAENNAPIWAAEGNHEQAEHTRTAGTDYRAAIDALMKLRQEAQ